MIWGLTVGNHFVPSQTSFFCSPVYSHQLREWHFGDFFVVVVHLELAVFLYQTIQEGIISNSYSFLVCH